MAREEARLRRGRDEETGESYFVSMSDLMAGVLFLFIIMLTNFALQMRAAPPPSARSVATPTAAQVEALRLEQAKAAAAARAPAGLAPAAPPDARTAALLAIADYLKARKVEATVDTAAGAVRLPNDTLFAPGGAGLSPGGRVAVDALASALAEVLPCFLSDSGPRAPSCPSGRGRIGAVFVEGHADTGVPADWSLSVGQSAAAFQGLIQARPGLQTLQSSSGQSLMGVGGYGPSRPVQPSGAPDARRVNNRVDLRLVLAS